MNLSTSQINQAWLEQVAQGFGVAPEVVLNSILDHLRQRDQAGKQSLPVWLDSFTKMDAQAAEVLEQARKVLSEAEAANKAAHLYLHLIESNQPKSAES